MQHFIKKQSIDLTITERKDAFRLQQLVSEHYGKEILGVLEKAFDEFSGNDEILRIDTLEIDLGCIKEIDILKGNWADILYARVSEKLRLLKQVSLPGITTTLQPQLVYDAEQWLYYMEHGHLPWHMMKTSKDWHTRVLQAFASDATSIERLREFIHRSKVGIERIVLQHPVEFIIALTEALTAHNQKILAVMTSELGEVFSYLDKWKRKERAAKEKYFSLQTWQTILVYAAKKKHLASPGKIVQYLIERIRIQGWALSLPPRFFSSKRLTAGIIQLFREAQLKEKMADDEKLITLTGKQEQEDSLAIKNESLSASQAREKIATSKENILPVNLPDAATKRSLSVKDEAIYVQQAGLVLLHPFLSPFFRNLGLLDNNAFIDISLHQKALFLLHFLGTGKTTAAEHELVMEKLLCGYPLQMPVPGQVELTKEEFDEAGELLENVIQHWKILKNTSADGLRESFLQRNGKLENGKDGPVVQVERTGIDILLADIPWTYSMIQLPWRKDLVRVEW
ncbi:MAG: contractile injection system tape measure protein [Chitinophagaceae bacterium]